MRRCAKVVGVNQRPQPLLVRIQELLGVLRAADEGEGAVDAEEQRTEEAGRDIRRRRRFELLRRPFVPPPLFVCESLLPLRFLIPCTLCEVASARARRLFRFRAALEEREVDACAAWRAGGGRWEVREQERSDVGASARVARAPVSVCCSSGN